jgi:hypothetical protein
LCISHTWPNQAVTVVVSGNEDVVHINKEHSWVFIFQGVEEVVHGFLECGEQVHQTKVHDIGLVQSVGCLKYGLVPVFWLDLNVIVPPLYVKGYEEYFALQLLKDVCDLWDRIDVLDRPFVNFSIILDRV